MSIKMSPAPEYEVVISGISGKFPDCHNVEDFKEKLFAKETLLRSDTDRWNPGQEKNPFISGKLPNSNKFDANFFGVHSKLVRNSDPMMGLMLERSFEAVMDAGINPFSLRGRNVGVISATSLSDSEILRITDGVFLEGFGMVGHSRTMMANRISYYFNFTGPSYNFDSSWTSALQSLELAARQVAQGTVESAIVVSANLLYYYSMDVQYRNLQLLSPDGKCSPFDNKANGFARSEGVVAFYIQRAQNAQRNYGSIVRAQTTYMGDRSCSYISLDSQIDRFFTNFYQECKIDPSNVAYIETGGFCNKEFDAIELNTIEQVFCKNKSSPMLIGCVKGNVGNSEAPSGLVALAKLIIAMESGLIPPTINYNNSNSQVPALASGLLKPVTETTSLSGDLLALNLLNCYGSISHVLVKRNDKSKKLPLESLPRLVLLQARHEEGANAITEKLNSTPLDTEFISLVNNAFKTPIPPYLWRTYTILPSSGKSAQNTKVFDPTKKPVWFVFSGMGSQWTEMGSDLLQLPVFEASINKSDEVLRPRGIDIKHILTSSDDSIFDNILNCFVGIAAVQIGLVDIMRTLGITPDGMIGHSVGELACAYADGCLSAQEMILAAYSRGKASLEARKEDIGGIMAAVGMGYEEIKNRLPESIDVACHNAADSCTLSGPTDDVLRYVEQLKQEGVFSKAVSAGGVAYHSRYIKSVAPKLLQYLQKVLPNPKPRSSNWISSSVPQSRWDTENAKMCSAEYHTNNLLSPVLFEEACQHLPKNAIAIEIAPHGLLQPILRRSLGSDVINVSLTSRSAQSNLTHLLNSLGQLYLNNVDMDINALYPTVSYPVSKSTPSLATLITWDHTEVCYKEFASRLHTLLKKSSTEKEFEINSNVEGYQLWQDHCIHNNVVLPITQLLMYPWKMILSYKRCEVDSTCVVMEDVSIKDQMVVDESEQFMMVTFSPVTFMFEISPNSSLDFKGSSRTLMRGKLYDSEISTSTDSVQKISENCSDMEEVATEELYSLLAQFGLNLGPQFQTIKKVLIGETGCFAKVQWTGNVVTFLDALMNIVVFLETDKQQCLYRPTYFNKLVVDMPVLSALTIDNVLDVEYNYQCNTLHCEGVQMHGITLGPVSQKEISNLIWNEIKFQPYFENRPTLDEFFSSTFQLVADNSFSPWTEKVRTLNVLELKEGNSQPAFSELLKYTSQSSFTIKITEVDVANAEKQLEVNGHQFHMVFGDLSAVAASSVQNNAYFIVYTSKNKFNTSSSSGSPKPILMYHSEAGVLVLLKKASPQTKLDVFEIESANWLKELRQHISKSNNDNPLIIVSRKCSPRVVLPVLAMEDKIKFMLEKDKIRTVFILDQDAPKFSPSATFYSNQLALGLPVNILSRGEWGSLTNFSANITSNQSKFEHLITSPQDGLEISCISPNISTFTLKRDDVPNEQEMNYLDYSGKVGAKKEMGIGQFDSETNKLTADAILKWPVPAEWTMEDAATVPAMYALAYYCIHLKGKVEKGERVLVHAGLSPLGQAMISIILHIGGIVFTSVESEDDVPILLKIFPILNPSHILVLGKDKIDITIKKQTAGEGVHVIVNCLRGKYMQDSVKAMGFDSRFVHLGQIRIEDKESIGLLVFLKRTSFYGVSLDNIANCTDAWKTKIQESLQLGIEQGIVKPFRRSEFLFQHETEALDNVSSRWSIEKTVLVKKHKLHLKSKRMLQLTPNNLIILAGEKGEEWLEVAEWLSVRGARKLVVLTNEHLGGSEVRRFNKLINRKKMSVIMSSFTTTESKEDVDKLYRNIIPFGQISHIFCVNMDENGNLVKNLDLASRQVLPDLQQFVTLLGEGSEVSDSRASAGLPVCSVKSNSPYQACTQLLPYLCTLLADNGPSARFFTVCDKINNINVQGGEDIQAFLPVSFTNLHLIGLQVTTNHGFTEAVTRSPGYSHVRYSLLPLFVVPGLGSQSFQPLLHQLIHPAFCSSLTANFKSVEKHTEILLEDLQNIQSQGPYNLVGDSWSGAVAIALGCKLEAQGHEVELFLLDGNPSSAKKRIRNLCDRFGGDLGTSLLSTILCLPQEVTKNISQLLSWEDKLQEGLKHVPADHYESISKALTSLYNQLTAVQQSQRPTQLFKGRVTLISCKEPSPADLNKFSEFCSGSPSIVVTGDQTRSELLANAQTASVINENINYSWKL